MSLYLRKTIKKDIELLYEWVNDPLVRMNSFNTGIVHHEEHVNWFNQSLANPDRDMYICMDGEIPVGQIRVDYDSNGNGVISYAVAADYRGKGYGRRMLELLEIEVAKKKGAGRYLFGEVKPENEASLRAFMNLGYKVSRKESDKIVVAKQVKKPGRDPNFEILRVVAMLMVIVLHYNGMGGLIGPLDVSMPGNQLGFWITEVLSIVCVNVYVLISGYFMADSKFKVSKLVKLWSTVLFYSVVVGAFALVTGIADRAQYLNLYNIQYLLMPITNNHYWFATAYILMYLFSPILSIAIKEMSQRQLRNTILLLLVPLCFVKSVIPFSFATDDKGNSFVWFLVLYMIAGYMRRYGIRALDSKLKGAVCYFASAAAIILHRYVIVGMHNIWPEYNFNMVSTNYNYIFVLTGAMGLFYWFKNMNFKNNKVTKFIVAIAPYTFGVYLLHVHLMIRYKWIELFSVSEKLGAFRVVHMIFTVLIVFAVGILVDFLRSCLFEAAERIPLVARISKKLRNVK